MKPPWNLPTRELFFGASQRGIHQSIALSLRLIAGGVFVGFGIPKFTNHAFEVREFDRYELPSPDVFVYAIGCVEIIGGVLLILGLVTRLATLVLAGDMLGAIVTAGRIEGGVTNLVLAPALLVTMLYLLWSGSGRYSLDSRIMGRRSKAMQNKSDLNL